MKYIQSLLLPPRFHPLTPLRAGSTMMRPLAQRMRKGRNSRARKGRNSMPNQEEEEEEEE